MQKGRPNFQSEHRDPDCLTKQQLQKLLQIYNQKQRSRGATATVPGHRGVQRRRGTGYGQWRLGRHPRRAPHLLSHLRPLSPVAPAPLAPGRNEVGKRFWRPRRAGRRIDAAVTSRPPPPQRPLVPLHAVNSSPPGIQPMRPTWIIWAHGLLFIKQEGGSGLSVWQSFSSFLLLWSDPAADWAAEHGLRRGELLTRAFAASERARGGSDGRS
jgi:hypothetical protein